MVCPSCYHIRIRAWVNGAWLQCATHGLYESFVRRVSLGTVNHKDVGKQLHPHSSEDALRKADVTACRARANDERILTCLAAISEHKETVMWPLAVDVPDVIGEVTERSMASARTVLVSFW